MNPSPSHVSSPETRKPHQQQPRSKEVYEQQSQPLKPSPFSFNNDISPRPSPTGSTSSSIFRSPQGSNPVSPVRMNLPDASAYSNMSANYNSLTSPPSKIDSPHVNTNQRPSPYVAYNGQSHQQLQQLYEADRFSSPIEFIEGTTAHTDKLYHSKDHTTTGRAVTPVLSSQASFPTSATSPTPREIVSPKISIQRSLKSSTESLKPPLPIISSNEKLDQQIAGRDLEGRSEVECLDSNFLLDPTDRVIKSPAISYFREDLSAFTEPHHQMAPKAKRPSALKFDSNYASLDIVQQPTDPDLLLAAQPQKSLEKRSDEKLTSPALSTTRPPKHVDAFNKTSLPAQGSLKLSASSSSTPSRGNQNLPSPSSANFPPIDNYMLDELKTLLREKLVELSQIQSQNAQLWALVNKQRTMIFDLQKDLDGAVEQNEKYRAILSKPHSSTSKPINSLLSPSIAISPSSQSKYRKDPKDISPSSRVRHSHDESGRQIPSIPRKSVESNASRQEIMISISNNLNNAKEPRTPVQSTHSVTSTPYQPIEGTPYDMLEKSQPSISSEVVLFVKPEEIPTIWLDISTLIGKVKSAYKKKEDPVALFTMLDRETKKELWKVLKDYSSLVALDHTIRPLLSQLNIPKLPERLLFQSHAPSKVDIRKVGMEEYFFSILKIPNLPPLAARALCEFLSTDMIDPMDIPDTISRREGYLTKRGKKIRGWKVRYFVIENDHLNYYDKPGGEVQGSINLVGAKVVRQNKSDPEFATEEAADKSFRHDFLLVEPKKKDYVRHVLCGESDEDRDLWITALMEVIDEVTSNPLVPIKVHDAVSPKKSVTPGSTSSNIAVNNSQDYDVGGRGSATPYSQSHDKLTSPINKKFGDININSELNPTGSIEEEDNFTKEPKKAKRKGFFLSFRNKNGNSSSQNQFPSSIAPGISENLDEFQATPYSAVEQQSLPSNQMKTADSSVTPSSKTLDEVVFAQQDSLASSDIPTLYNRSESPVSGELQLKRVFGVPLQEAISLASKQVHNCIVPAIVYRCIEHLKYRDAIFEEGIFRLSGSTSTIRALKDRFNTEYDIDLVSSETFYDIHAVAGLLKLYLREIPSLILSPYLAPEFREAVDIDDPVTKILKLKSLVQEIPRENRDLLCVLFSLLTEVVSYSELNKMNLRNIGIVFAQTLNISAYVLIPFLTDFDAIFGDDEEETLDEESGVEEGDLSKQPLEQIDGNDNTIKHYQPRPLPSPSQQQQHPEFMTLPP